MQWHHHPGDCCRKVGPVHYVTLTAMVTGRGLENNAYGILEVYSDGTLRLQGFGRQKSFMLPFASAGPVTASGPGL